MQLVLLAVVWVAVLASAAARWFTERHRAVRELDTLTAAFRDPARPAPGRVTAPHVSRRRQIVAALAASSAVGSACALALRNRASVGLALAAIDGLLLYVTALAASAQRRRRSARPVPSGQLDVTVLRHLAAPLAPLDATRRVRTLRR